MSAARPITCPAPSPPLSPKRKLSDDISVAPMKKQRLDDNCKCDSPLYKNFGNGLSVCNNTNTYFFDIEEVIDFLQQEGELATEDFYDQNVIDEENLCDDVLRELIDDLKSQENKELPELNLNLADLRELITSELDFI